VQIPTSFRTDVTCDMLLFQLLPVAQPMHTEPASLPRAFALSSQYDSSPTLSALHKGTDDTWQAASRCARDVKHFPFVLASKLQLAQTEGIEHTLYEQCLASCGAYQQAIRAH